MKKSNVSDEQIIEKIIELGNPSDRQIAMALGITPNGKFSQQLRQIRKNNNIPEPERKITGRPAKKGSEIQKEKPEKPIKKDPPKEAKINTPFPFEPQQQVIHAVEGLCTVRNIGESRMILTRNANLKTITVFLEDIQKDPKIVRKMKEDKPTGMFERVTRNRKRPDEEAEPAAPETDFLDLPEPPELDESEPEKTIFEKVAKESKRKPGMTINPEFDDLFKPIDKITTDASENIIASANKMEPLHIDLEMEDSADPVHPFEDVDYTDTEWFDKPIPRKGTVERAIWDKAYQEIAEIQTLRASIQTALSKGGRLPTVDIERYNKFVSKYSEEVGA